MRLAVFAPALRVGGGLSVGKNLVDSLLRRGTTTDAFRFVVPPGVGYEDLIAKWPAADIRLCPPVRLGSIDRARYDLFQAKKDLEGFQPNAIFGIGGFGFVNPPAPQLMMIQDPNLCYPSVYSPLSPARMRLYFLKKAVARRIAASSALVVQTDVMGDRLSSTFGFKGPVHVVSKVVSRDVKPVDPEGYADIFSGQSKEPRFKFLCVSRYYPQKNFELVLEAYVRHSDILKGTSVYLTFSPTQCRGAARLERAITRHGLQEHISLIGPVPSSDLRSVYHHADAVLLPTKRESFSGAYIEAMGFEKPIVTTNLDFARTVCGEAAEYFDDDCAESLAVSMSKLANHKEHCDALVRLGRDRLTQFPDSWDQIANKVMLAAQQVAGGT